MKYGKQVWSSTLLAALLLAGLAGCSDGTTGGTIYIADAKGDGINFNLKDGKGDGLANDASDDATPTDDGGSTDDASTDGPGYLYYDLGVAAGKPPKGDDGIPCLDTCQVGVTQNSTRPIGALVLIDKKFPLENAMVQFTIKDPSTTDATIQSGTVPTDQDGRASTIIKAGMQTGFFLVTVSVVDRPDILPIEYTMSVQSKVKGPPTITLHYQGATSLSGFGDLNVRLIKQVAGEPACKNLDIFDKDNLPPSVSTSPNLKFDKPWSIAAAYLGTLPADGSVVSYTVVALGWKLGTGSMSGNPSIGGCLDTGFTVHLNKSTKGVEGDSVLINVRDLPLRLKGVYDMTTFIDLLTLLPPTAEKLVKIVLNIVSDPVAGLLATICQLTNGSLQDICAAIFTDPANPDPSNLTSGVGGIIVSILTGVIDALLPPQVLQVITSAKDLKGILENFTVTGTIEINAEPDTTGYLSSNYTKQTWAAITYKWSLGQSCPPTDPNCGKKTINFDQFQADAVTGSFDLWRNFLPNSQVPDGTIKFGKHALNVKWGALVNFILEKQLLPLLTYDSKDPTAPTIDSYEKLIKWLLGGNKKCLIKDTCCADFVGNITSQTGLASNLLTGACNAATTLGSAFLEGYLNSLDGVSGNPATGQGLVLGTDKCPILDPNGDNIVDDLGSPDTTSTTNQCQWDMTLGIGGGTPKAISARFFAIRQP